MFDINDMYYDREGNKVSEDFWISKFRDWDYKRVDQTNLPSGGRVSTVWLGMDHSWGDGPPLVFETMVFDHPEWYDYQGRYTTLEQAQEGHDKIVAAIAAGITADEFYALN